MKTKSILLSTCLAVAASLGAGLITTGCAGSATRESTGEYIDDSVITAKVKAALAADEDVSALAVNVETFKGTVQLSGFVNSAAEKEQAAIVARAVNGVKDVQNNISVK